MDEPRKFSLLAPSNEPLCLYGQQEKNYSPAGFNFNFKKLVPSPSTCSAIVEFGFCPDRLRRIELEDLDCEDALLYDPDRLVFVASYSDRLRAILPSDCCMEEMQAETLGMFLFFEYLAKCRERGAFIKELREDWASGLDVYPLVSQAWKSGLIQKEQTAHNTAVVLARFVNRSNLNSNPEEKLPPNVVIFDKAFAEYRKLNPGAVSMPRKCLVPYYGHDAKKARRVADNLKQAKYLRTMYVKTGTKNRLGLLSFCISFRFSAFPSYLID